MGPGFVVLFWLVAFGVLGAVWLALVVAAFVGWRKKLGWLKWLAGVPAALMLGGGMLLAGLMAWGIVHAMNPKNVFEDAFGVAVSGETDVRSRVFSFADTGSVYLRFQTTPEGFRKLVPPHLREMTAAELARRAGSDSSTPPEWWTFRRETAWLYYGRIKSHEEAAARRGFAYEIEYLAYDPATGTAYYRFLGID